MGERRQQIANQVSVFVRKYARKKQRGHSNHDPNDRTYDRKVEQMVRRMDPAELDALIRQDGEPDDQN